MERPEGGSIPRSQSLAHSKLSLAPGRSSSNRVVINVGGVRYETFRSTLKSIPDTRLSWLTEAQSHNPDYDPATGEFFFDRHPGVFNMILNYYRTGKLHAPADVCGPLFEEELAFWGIDEKQIEPCCWPGYSAHRDAQQTLAELESDHGSDDSDDDGDGDEEIARRFGIVEEAREEKHCFQRWQPRIWHLLEDPSSSPGAQIISIVSVVFVLVFIAIFVAESHIKFRDLRPGVNVTLSEDLKVRELQEATEPKVWLKALEYACVTYFTLELLLRVIFCPDKAALCRHVLTWVDLVSVLPTFLQLVIAAATSSSQDGLYVISSLRMIRIFRILRLTRYFSGLKILGHTLRASAKELMLLIMVLGIGVLVFASFVFYFEQVDEDPKNDFKNIPIGFWWAVVTMTTLGYGDIYPRTAFGYVVGAICALCGLLMLALPVPVIVNNFTLYYSHAQAKMRLPQKKKNVLVGAADALKTSDAGADGSLDTSNVMGAASVSVNGSTRSVNSLSDHKVTTARRGSGDSTGDSIDSGFKTASTDGEPGGISVIFTDELVAACSPSRYSPSPQTKRSSGKWTSTNVGDGIDNRADVTKTSGATSRRRSVLPSKIHVDIVDVDV